MSTKLKVKIIEKIDSKINDQIYNIGEILDVYELSLFPSAYAYYHFATSGFLEGMNSVDWIPKEMAEIIK